MPRQDLRIWGGLVSHADPEDLEERFLTAKANLRSFNGRLRKTFGYGDSGIPVGDLEAWQRLRNIATHVEGNEDLAHYLGIKIGEGSGHVDIEDLLWGGLLDDFENVKAFAEPNDFGPVAGTALSINSPTTFRVQGTGLTIDFDVTVPSALSTEVTAGEIFVIAYCYTDTYYGRGAWQATSATSFMGVTITGFNAPENAGLVLFLADTGDAVKVSGDITQDDMFYVDGTITYNSTVYTDQVFFGVAGQTTFTGGGTVYSMQRADIRPLAHAFNAHNQPRSYNVPYEDPIAVTAVSDNGDGTVRITATHDLQDGEIVSLRGFTPTSYNTEFEVSVASGVTTYFDITHTFATVSVLGTWVRADFGFLFDRDWAYDDSLYLIRMVQRQEQARAEEMVQNLIDQQYGADGNPIDVVADDGGGDCRFDTNTPHGLSVSDEVYISGFNTQTTYNGIWTVSNIHSTTEFDVSGLAFVADEGSAGVVRTVTVGDFTSGPADAVADIPEGIVTFNYNTHGWDPSRGMRYPIEILDVDTLRVRPYIRCGTIMWWAKALLFFALKYPASTKAPHAKIAARNAIEAVIKHYLIDSVSGNDKRINALVLGRGNFTGAQYRYDAAPNCANEHNVDYWWALDYGSDPDIGFALRNAAGPTVTKTWQQWRDLIGAKLVNDTTHATNSGFWSEALGRTLRGKGGVSPDYDDDEFHALDNATWYASFAVAYGRLDRARDALKILPTYFQTDLFNHPDKGLISVTGYPAYTASLHDVVATPLVWPEGSFGAAHAFLALGDLDSYLEQLRRISVLRLSDGFPYVSRDDIINQMRSWSSLVATAWSGIAMEPEGWWGTDTLLSQISLGSNLFYHDTRKNPVILTENSIRALPGKKALIEKTLPVQSITQSGNLFLLIGDQRAYLQPGQDLVLSGAASATNQTYTVSSVSLNSDGNTEAVMNEDPGSDDTTGNLAFSERAQGIHIAYLERIFFDDLYSPAAGYHVVQTRILPPTLSALGVTARQVPTVSGRAYANNDVRYYWFSYVYDGGVESLLSNALRVDFTGNAFPEFQIPITTTSHNRRITGIRIYRTSTVGGSLVRIMSVDFLRPASDTISGADGGYTGNTAIYIPALSDYNFGAHTYAIRVEGDNTERTIDTPPAGTGSDTFVISSGLINAGDWWNRPWYLKENGTIVRGDEDGAYTGNKAMMVSEDLTGKAIANDLIHVVLEHSQSITAAAATGNPESTQFTTAAALGVVVGSLVTLSGFTTNPSYNGTYEVLSFSGSDFVVETPFIDTTVDSATAQYDGNPVLIDRVYQKALKVTGIFTPAAEDKPWKLARLSKGLYTTELSGSVVTYKIYDPAITAGVTYPLVGVVSTEVHGRFARLINDRLWQGNVIVDPNNKAEEFVDGVTYSRVGQYDLTPAANFLKAFDQQGGPVTGIAQLFNQVVIFKRQAILTIATQHAPTLPSAWIVVETPHNIGNVAPHGYIEVGGEVFFCYLDGIYSIRANNLAESDATPTERLRVSDDIEDIYQALLDSDLSNILASYDPALSEVHFKLGARTFAFHVVDRQWREIVTARDIVLYSQDEQANILAYDEQDGEIGVTGNREPTVPTLATKVFRTSSDRKEVVRRLYVTYQASEALTLNIYAEHSTSALKTLTLPIKATRGTHKLHPKVRASKFKVEITGPESIKEVDIDRIEVDYD